MDASKSVCTKYRCAKTMGQALSVGPRLTAFGFLLNLSHWDDKPTCCLCGIDTHSGWRMEEKVDSS